MSADACFSRPVLPFQGVPALLRFPPSGPIQRCRPVSPLVQYRPMHAQFFSQFENAVAVPHSLDRPLPKGPWILSHSSFPACSFFIRHVSSLCCLSSDSSTQECVRHPGSAPRKLRVAAEDEQRVQGCPFICGGRRTPDVSGWLVLSHFRQPHQAIVLVCVVLHPFENCGRRSGSDEP